MNTPELIELGQLQIRFLIDPADVNQSVSMFEVMVAANAKVPAPHSHIAYDETIYGLEGTCTFTIGKQEFSIGPGNTLFIPRGAVHQFVNRSPARMSFLAVVTPGILGPQYFRELGEILRAGGPPDPKRVSEVMLKHGLKPAA